jgi:hypothetical protein
MESEYLQVELALSAHGGCTYHALEHPDIELKSA